MKNLSIREPLAIFYAPSSKSPNSDCVLADFSRNRPNSWIDKISKVRNTFYACVPKVFFEAVEICNQRSWNLASGLAHGPAECVNESTSAFASLLWKPFFTLFRVVVYVSLSEAALDYEMIGPFFLGCSRNICFHCTVK